LISPGGSAKAIAIEIPPRSPPHTMTGIADAKGKDFRKMRAWHANGKRARCHHEHDGLDADGKEPGSAQQDNSPSPINRNNTS
jgi:hypothetical protein